MHLLDTDTLTHLHAGHPQVIAHVLAVNDPVVGTTIITKGELLRGRIDFLLKAAIGAELVRARQWCIRTEELLAQILFIPFDETAAAQFDQLPVNNAYRNIGRRISYSPVLSWRITQHWSPEMYAIFDKFAASQ